VRVGKEAFVFHGMAAGRLVETAFEIREDDIGAAKLVLDEREGHRRVGHVHQVHVTGQDHLDRHFSSRLAVGSRDHNRASRRAPPWQRTSPLSGEGACEDMATAR
jgi:hypothetical protein